MLWKKTSTDLRDQELLQHVLLLAGTLEETGIANALLANESNAKSCKSVVLVVLRRCIIFICLYYYFLINKL